MSTLICAKCNTPNENSVRYCINCGANLAIVDASTSDGIDHRIELNLAHFDKVSDYQRSTYGYAYNKNYLIQPVSVKRPVEGVSKETLYCQYCNKPFVLTVESLGNARKTNILSGVVGLIVSLVIGAGLVLLGINYDGGLVILAGVFVLGVGSFSALKLIFRKPNMEDGISISGDTSQIEHKLLSVSDIAKMKSKSVSG